MPSVSSRARRRKVASANLLTVGPQPSVSVVVPVRNCAATIAGCLEGLLAQTYPRELTRILIVDNNSTDETRAIAARYPVTLLSEREIQTSYAARNRGVTHADESIVAFTDGDCMPDREWLRYLVEPFADSAVSAVAGSVDDANASSLCEEFTARVQPFARPVCNGLRTLLTANVAIRRSALEPSACSTNGSPPRETSTSDGACNRAAFA